ncbi:MAG: helix-turn-helix transcriptional regulator, partial [Planctomycetes bacterium]|nr:helix-turn-helix transcriptional regulator [Planctomycetota bacterium]
MAALLARRERQGLTLRELSKKTGIPFGTLSWWSWRLRQEPARRRGGEQFVEVEVTPAGHREVVVRVADIEISASAGTDVVWLRDLDQALPPCCAPPRPSAFPFFRARAAPATHAKDYWPQAEPRYGADA